MAKNKADCIKAATKPTTKLTDVHITAALFDAITTIMLWMPDQDRSKAITVPDPRDETKLIAIHVGPKGPSVLADGDYQTLISILCNDCIAELKPYSIIYTGLNCTTGEPDPEAFIGLAGGHDEDEKELGEIEMEIDEDDIDEEWVAEPPKKRTLN